ncbi:MAG: fructose 1,6-bisphosphatase [Candidatus Bathyarchaeota archaeon]|nr:MAG: fructose 1,6-bisphosphatase [Candidatus Bathyarchaeota archaeon]
MTDWLSALEVCSKRIRKEVLPLFGKADAATGFGKGAGGDVMKKIDLTAEKAMIDTLRNLGASCTLISEESGVKEIGSQPSDSYLTTDPIDGTTNAVRGIPFFVTSIAVSKAPYLRDVEVALVSDLIHDITYTAKRGHGAFKNGKRIQASTASSLKEAVVGINLSAVKKKNFLAPLVAMLKETRHLRHLGANALELCYVADGTSDAFIEPRGKLRVTDIAAAYLIVREAGSIMLGLEGEELDAPLTPTQTVSFISAANTLMYETIKKLLLSC